jgi:hypothetical protein
VVTPDRLTGILRTFRKRLYSCKPRRVDALFELSDALLAPLPSVLAFSWAAGRCRLGFPSSAPSGLHRWTPGA